MNMIQSVMRQKSRSLWAFALGMGLCGVAFIVYDPTAAKVAFYPKAMTGLIACSIIAGLSGVAAVLTAKKGRPGWYLGLGVIFLTLAMMSSMALKRWKSTSSDPTKTYAAMITSMAALWSLVQFVSVARGAAWATIEEEKKL